MNSNNVVADLYQAHNGWLKGWLQRRLGCSSEVADLAQDTFVKVLGRNLEGLREPRAFLRTIAHGLLVDKVRRKELERAYLATLQQLPEALAPSPELTCSLLESLYALDRLLANLPTKVRQAFLLCQLDGLKYAEAAEQLGVTVSSVKKYMRTALLHCLELQA
ncbi:MULTISPECIES: sigma-70 family RNA polymerase sigma factor [Pseudomonas]|uniref:RNA polymerase subunit sigma n=1 Tax=Pseudomonas soli TaxID=1306993 RepID=A0A2V4HIH6_9PSED|nr:MULTISPECIES: sigma-70 family RNA polymerase sigma factor [Pseudomonas]PYB76145.1 RNA polymerase subunit sigma [Pseudomonas soli]PZW82300.1 RNA polymerase sigma-70 factor (ECF subfamily) [Pseudomonas sp. 2848]